MSETPQSAATTSKPPVTSPSVTRLVEWAAIIGVAVALSLVVRVYVFQTFYIPSGSMEPTLLIGDRIIIDKLAVDFGTINRGDVVVFHAPPAVASQCGDADADLHRWNGILAGQTRSGQLFIHTRRHHRHAVGGGTGMQRMFGIFQRRIPESGKTVGGEPVDGAALQQRLIHQRCQHLLHQPGDDTKTFTFNVGTQF